MEGSNPTRGNEQAMEKEVLHGTCNRSSAVCPPFTTAGIGFAPGVVPSASYIHPPLHQHQPALAHPAAITPTTAIASEAIACPPLPPFLTNPPEDYVQDSEWAEGLVRLELGQFNDVVQQHDRGPEEKRAAAAGGGARDSSSSSTPPPHSRTAELEAVLQRKGSEGDSEDLAAMAAAATACSESGGSSDGSADGVYNSLYSSSRRRRSGSWALPDQGLGGAGYAGPHGTHAVSYSASQSGVRGFADGSGPGKSDADRERCVRRGSYRARHRTAHHPLQPQLSGFQQQFTHAAKLQCRGIKGCSAVSRQNNAILQRLDARMSAHVQGMEQMQQLVQATSQMAEWAQQVHSLSRELGVWKNECNNKHELWIRATELLQDREHQLLLMQSELMALQQKQQASATNNDKELLHHSQHELQNVTEALLASQSECKALQQALQQQQQQQQQQQKQAALPVRTSDKRSLPSLPNATTQTPGRGAGAGESPGAPKLVSVQLTPAPLAGRRSSDGGGNVIGDPDVVITGGGVVAEALVNAHMSELTQSSGTTRTKEVDRVIRRSAVLLKKFVEKNNVQMRDREQRIAELKKRCRELEAALEALAYSATVSPSNGAGVLETGDHSLPDTAARQGSAGTDGREHRGASTCPTRPAGATASSSIAVRELDRSGSGGSSRGAAVAHAVALLQEKGPARVRQRHVGVQTAEVVGAHGEQGLRAGDSLPGRVGLQGAGAVKQLEDVSSNGAAVQQQQQQQQQDGASVAGTSTAWTGADLSSGLERQLAEVQGQLEDAQRQVQAHLEGQAAAAAAAAATAHADAERATQLEQRLMDVQGQLQAAQKQVQAQLGKQAQLEAHLEGQIKGQAAAAPTTTTTEASEAPLKRQLAEVQQQAAWLQRELQEAHSRLAEAQTQSEAQAASVAGQARQLTEAQLQVAQLQRELQYAHSQLAEAQAQSEAQAASVTKQAQQLAEITSQLQEAHRQLAAAQMHGEVQAASMAAQAQQLADAQARAEEAHSQAHTQAQEHAAYAATQAQQLADAEARLVEVERQVHEQGSAQEADASGTAIVIAKLVETEARLMEVQTQAREHAEQATAAQAQVAELEAKLVQALAQHEEEQQQQQQQQQQQEGLHQQHQQQKQEQQQQQGQEQRKPEEQTAQGGVPLEGKAQEEPDPRGGAPDVSTQLLLAQSRASALESELALMRQRMRALVSLASTAAQHKLQHNHKKGSNTGTISGSDAAEQSQEPEAGQQKLHEQQQQQQEQQSDAVLSLLGVLRGMDAAHLQESGVDASLQRVRLLQGQMEKVLLATLGHSARDDALDRAVVQAAQVLGLPLVPSGHTQQGQLKQGDTGQGQQLVQQQQRQLNSGLDFGQPNAGPGPTSHKEGCSSGAAQQAGGMQPHGICNEHDWLSRPPAASGGGSTQGQQQDDLLQGLEDNDWDRLPAFTPPPDFS